MDISNKILEIKEILSDFIVENICSQLSASPGMAFLENYGEWCRQSEIRSVLVAEMAVNSEITLEGVF